MEFSNNQLNRLRNILVGDYGIDLSDAELNEFAMRATRMAYISYKHMFRRIKKGVKESVEKQGLDFSE
jgi:hypothetical protein